MRHIFAAAIDRIQLECRILLAPLERSASVRSHRERFTENRLYGHFTDIAIERIVRVAYAVTDHRASRIVVHNNASLFKEARFCLSIKIPLYATKAVIYNREFHPFPLLGKKTWTGHLAHAIPHSDIEFRIPAFSIFIEHHLHTLVAALGCIIDAHRIPYHVRT